MGRDKAWLEIDGLSMIERVIAALAPVTTSLAIIANTDDYNRLGLPVFRDTNKGIGPLEAIRTALANSDEERVALVGCDLPFVTAELFSFLLDCSGDYQAVVPLGNDNRLEPLCAIYSTGALQAVVDLIESGERKVSPLFDRISTKLIPFREINHLPRSEFFFENINTPEQYARALARFKEAEAGGG
jgi:molybdopterin-guanine dinucleotide biosynthesis protein A